LSQKRKDRIFPAKKEKQDMFQQRKNRIWRKGQDTVCPTESFQQRKDMLCPSEERTGYSMSYIVVPAKNG
jgi:hypothetical protein